MNAERVLHLRSGDVLVAVAFGRAAAWSVGEDEAVLHYWPGERVYVVRYEDEDTPEAFRICDGRYLGRITLRNWQPVTRCDACLAEAAEHELGFCPGCGVRHCAACGLIHGLCGRGKQAGARPRHQSTLQFKPPKVSASKNGKRRKDETHFN